MKQQMHRPLAWIFTALSLYFLQVGTTLFVNSTYVREEFLLSNKETSAIFVASALLSLGLVIVTPYLIRWINNANTIILYLVVQLFCIGVFMANPQQNMAIPAMIIYLSLQPVFIFLFDILVKKNVTTKHTGESRGLYVMLMNTAIGLGPLIMGSILAFSNSYPLMYSVAGIITLITLILIIVRYTNFKSSVEIPRNLHKTWHSILKKPELVRITITSLALQSFFATMMIYTPLYLHEVIGLSWGALGLILSIMLVPFMLFSLPLGKLMDSNMIHERYILVYGGLILSISTILLSFISSSLWWVWAMLLFITRVGASAVQVSTESYFFKHINARDIGLASFFRDANPIGYAIAPLFFGMLITFTNFKLQYIFIVLGTLVGIAIFLTLPYKETNKVYVR